MNTEERRALFEQYGRERRNKRIRTALIALILLASIAAVYLYGASPNAPDEPGQQPTAIAAPPQYTGAVFANATNPGKYKLQTDLLDGQCYWVRSTTGMQGYVLEIREYNSSGKNCVGTLLNTTEIPLKKPLNIIGNDCICGKKVCELENVLEGKRINLKIKGC